MTRDYRLIHHLRVPLPRSAVFPFFAAAENLAAITPPELGFRLVTPRPIAMREGTRLDYTIRIAGVRLRWRSEITLWDPPHAFVDTQTRGPYAHWAHLHRFTETDGVTTIEDVVDYRLPFGMLGRLGHAWVRRRLDHIFRFRAAAVLRLLPPPTGDRRP